MMFSKQASEKRHRFRVLIAWIVSMAFVGAFAAYGFDYYTLSWKDRPFSPKHMLLRPSGPIGVNLGIFGVLMFFLIYLYPLRKRWGWLGKQGNSRHWLDFHRAFRDDREPPLLSGETGGFKPLICPSRLGKNSAFSRVDVRFCL